MINLSIKGYGFIFAMLAMSCLCHESQLQAETRQRKICFPWQVEVFEGKSSSSNLTSFNFEAVEENLEMLLSMKSQGRDCSWELENRENRCYLDSERREPLHMLVKPAKRTLLREASSCASMQLDAGE